jgi:hypothetical protein
MQNSKIESEFMINADLKQRFGKNLYNDDNDVRRRYVSDGGAGIFTP